MFLETLEIRLVKIIYERLQSGFKSCYAYCNSADSYVSPSAYIDTNIKGTLNLLQTAKELGIKKFIHTSTSEVYGSAQYIPVDEQHPLVGQSPYAASKIGADQLAYSFLFHPQYACLNCKTF